MRFTKGCKVEVLCKKDVSFGAWRCAEIIVDGGDTYKVRCEPTPGMSNGKIVDRVPSTDIRPSPPRLESVVNWAPGDVLEVLDDGSWKTATVLKVGEGDYCLIRILGSFEEFRVHTSKTRLRQTWKDDKWIVMGKAYQSREFTKSSNILDFICYDVPQADARVKENNRLQDSYIVSARSLKRASPFCSSYVEAYPSKVRAVEEQREEGRQVVSRSSSSLLNVVDDDDVERERSPNGASSCYLERSTGFSESDDTHDSDDIDTDSVVDSCSVNSNRMNEFPGNVLAGPSQAADSDCSDAESFCGRRDEDEEKDTFPSQEEEASRIHRLELHAYRSTMVAIYASGPLTWEQEELLTNLRITLHISHDEHLHEVRNLISSGNPSSFLAYNRQNMNARLMPLYV